MIEVASNRRVFVAFPLSGMKGQCLAHRNCVCWLNAAATRLEGREPLLDLVKWAHCGLSMSEMQHFKASQELKLSYGMKVKVPE